MLRSLPLQLHLLDGLFSLLLDGLLDITGSSPLTAQLLGFLEPPRTQTDEQPKVPAAD